MHQLLAAAGAAYTPSGGGGPTTYNYRGVTDTWQFITLSAVSTMTESDTTEPEHDDTIATLDDVSGYGNDPTVNGTIKFQNDDDSDWGGVEERLWPNDVGHLSFSSALFNGFDPIAGSPWTAIMLMRLRAGRNGTLFSRTDTTNNRTMQLYVSSSDAFFVYLRGSAVSLETSTDLNDGSMHAVGIRCDGAATPVVSVFKDDSTFTPSIGTGAINSASFDINVFARTSGLFILEGGASEIAIIDKSLSDTDINTIFNDISTEKSLGWTAS